jgi:hypothetical protein
MSDNNAFVNWMAEGLVEAEEGQQQQQIQPNNNQQQQIPPNNNNPQQQQQNGIGQRLWRGSSPPPLFPH